MDYFVIQFECEAI